MKRAAFHLEYICPLNALQQTWESSCRHPHCSFLPAALPEPTWKMSWHLEAQKQPPASGQGTHQLTLLQSPSKQPDCKPELREVADSRTTDLHSKEQVPARQNPTGKRGNKQRFIPPASHTNFYSALIYINFMITASQNYCQLALSWKIAFR